MRLHKKSKLAIGALALIAGGWMFGEALIVGGGPGRRLVGGILMWTGVIGGSLLFVLSTFVRRENER